MGVAVRSSHHTNVARRTAELTIAAPIKGDVQPYRDPEVRPIRKVKRAPVDSAAPVQSNASARSCRSDWRPSNIKKAAMAASVPSEIPLKNTHRQPSVPIRNPAITGPTIPSGPDRADFDGQRPPTLVRRKGGDQYGHRGSLRHRSAASLEELCNIKASMPGESPARAPPSMNNTQPPM